MNHVNGGIIRSIKDKGGFSVWDKIVNLSLVRKHQIMASILRLVKQAAL
jgi:hypothetical protein